MLRGIQSFICCLTRALRRITGETLSRRGWQRIYVKFDSSRYKTHALMLGSQSECLKLSAAAAAAGEGGGKGIRVRTKSPPLQNKLLAAVPPFLRHARLALQNPRSSTCIWCVPCPRLARYANLLSLLSSEPCTVCRPCSACQPFGGIWRVKSYIADGRLFVPCCPR